MEHLHTLIRLLIIASPAILAASLHMVVVKFNLLAFINRPLDLGKTFRGKRIFGDNKTFRGIVVMVIFSIAFCYLYLFLMRRLPVLREFNLLRLGKYSPLLFGCAYGLGYTLFELPNSFIKRQRNILPGTRSGAMHVILDQADSVLGCFLFLYPFSKFTPQFALAGVVLFTFIHMFMNFILYLIGLRKNPL